MDKSLKDIMDQVAPVWGVCDYNFQPADLIPCSKTKDMPKRAASILVALFPHALEEENYENANISRYAAVKDYHKVALSRLGDAAKKLKMIYPEEEFVAFCDNSPIPEVRVALEAGLGVRGENNLLINPKYGSWVFIGEIVTGLKIQSEKHLGLKRCIGCALCLEACPTKILGKNVFAKEACLSQISQRKGELKAEEEDLIRRTACAWGCDICQLVCPMNEEKEIDPLSEFREGFKASYSLGDDITDRAFAWRGLPVIERNVKLLN